MDAPTSQAPSIAEMVAACRAYVGHWTDLFRYDSARARWYFLPPGGGGHRVNYTTMPEIAHEMGGWGSKAVAS
jgi:hypothetical protein